MRAQRARRVALVVAALVLVQGPGVATALAAAPTSSCGVALYVADSADRSAAIPLAEASLQRNRFLFADAPRGTGRDRTEATTPLASVTFTLRPTGSAPTAVITENLAPFDLRTTDARGAAAALTTRALADGSWTVSASWTYKNALCAGAVRSTSATFTIDNTGPAPGAECALAAYVSSRPDRSDAQPLSDAVVRGKVYVFVANGRGSTRDLYPASTVLSAVTFSLDAADGTAGSAPYPGPPVTRTERVAPFDLAGGTGDRSGTGDPVATPWDSGAFPVGEYTLATSYAFVDDSIFGCGDAGHANNASFTVIR